MAPNKEANGPLEIIIKTRNNRERDQLGSEIHNLLKGNPDYKDNFIVLNIDSNKRVRLWIFDESKTQLKVVPVKESTYEAGRESYR